MSRFIIVEPMAAAIAASRGTGVANLSSYDPKEVWADNASGNVVTFTIDLGAALPVDTIFLGYATPASTAAVWSITGGLAGAGETIVQAQSAFRVPDVAGSQPALSHALWHGAARTVRYLAISVTQPSDAAPLAIGRLIVGKAFIAGLGQEWGFGRTPIDTGSATALPGGGFAIVGGVRLRSVGWTFGDLSIEEADRLELIALALGETTPGIVVEDPAATAGLRSRIHYGLFSWRAWERRNRRQTRWEISIREWA